jgi:hypothetical protein
MGLRVEGFVSVWEISGMAWAIRIVRDATLADADDELISITHLRIPI